MKRENICQERTIPNLGSFPTQSSVRVLPKPAREPTGVLSNVERGVLQLLFPMEGLS